MDIIVKDNYFKILEVDQIHAKNQKCLFWNCCKDSRELWCFSYRRVFHFSPYHSCYMEYRAGHEDLHLCCQRVWFYLVWVLGKNPYQGRLLKTIEKQSRNNGKQSGMANFTPILTSCCSVEQAAGKWTSHKCSRSSWELVFVRQVVLSFSHN